MIKKLLRKLGFTIRHNPIVFDGVAYVASDEDANKERVRIRRYWDGTWELV